MKRHLMRLLALLICLALPAQSAGAAVLGGILRQNSQTIATGTTYRTTTYWSSNASGRETEHLYTYSPNSTVTPQVYYGTTLYGRSTLDTLAASLTASGQTIVAAINGSFFDFSTGIPYGAVVTDGILRTSGDILSVGFRADGTAVIGKPGLTVKLSGSFGSATVHYNKALTKTNGVVVYSNDYDTKTKSTVKSYNIIVKPDKDELTLRGTVKATVQYTGEVYSAEIPEGCFTISMAVDTPYTTTLSQLQSLKAGDTIAITTNCDDEWVDVQNLCGGGDLLVEDGTVCSDFTLDSAKVRTCRTAIGIKADGTVVAYTIDGLQTSSVGVTLAELAQRMAELGCVTALNLDGGGSTTATLRYPGYDTLTTVNSPSDGKQRKCANFIFFTMPTETAGETALLHLYPAQAVALPNATIQYSVRASDANYRTTSVPSGINYETDNGTVTTDALFTAGTPGTSTITASTDSAIGTATVTVIESPTAISILRSGSVVSGSSIQIADGATVDLSATAAYSGFTVYASDRSFTWSVTGDIGTIDADGKFTANGSGTTGTITATCGKTSASVSVTVTNLDTTPPTITTQLANGTLTAVITDAVSSISELTLTCDDAPVDYEWDGKTLTAQIASNVTIIKLTAADQRGNRAGAAVETGYHAANPFVDTQSHWAANFVSYLSAQGVLQGSYNAAGEAVYKPDDAMTREAFLTALIRWLGVDTSQYANVTLPFADQSSIASYALPAVRAAYSLGYLTGSKVDGVLYANPKATITRQEAMTILGRSQPDGYPAASLSAFSDADSVSSYAKTYVAQMVARGIIAGSNGRLNPKSPVTRAQVAKMLYYLT
jgi:exopolysaccharide biosynthesis protein